MMNLFQRIVRNDFGWERPSPGRLGPLGEGNYVKKNGFGHDDWNFNKDYAINGSLYGYCFYEPAEANRKKNFNFAFAHYMHSNWYLSGFYLNAKFVSKVPVKKSVLRNKMKDLLMLDDSLGPTWRRLIKSKFMEKLQKQAQWSKWQVDQDNAIRISQPVEIPKRVFECKNYRLARPTGIDKGTFDALLELGKI